jgi:hypothetical protein
MPLSARTGDLVDLIAVGGGVEGMSPSRDGNLWASRDERLARRSLRDLAIRSLARICGRRRHAPGEVELTTGYWGKQGPELLDHRLALTAACR